MSQLTQALSLLEVGRDQTETEKIRLEAEVKSLKEDIESLEYNVQVCVCTKKTIFPPLCHLILIM